MSDKPNVWVTTDGNDWIVGSVPRDCHRRDLDVRAD